MYETLAFLCVGNNNKNVVYTHMSFELICGRINQLSHLIYSLPSYEIDIGMLEHANRHFICILNEIRGFRKRMDPSVLSR